MFRVERSPLLSEIWSLTEEHSVLLTGSPGVGKSWVIAQFVRRCKAEKRPSLPMAAEDFEVKSIEDLSSALGFKREVVPFLEALGERAVLIIDGLDALRSETSQRVFRDLIRLVNSKIPQCAIVASIRSFDLKQSGELQELFLGARYGSSTRQFREVIVEPFSEADLQEVVKQEPALQTLLRDSGRAFQELLRNPFNLHLADQLLDKGVSAQELTPIQSQVQLLGKYWKLRIEEPSDGHDRKALLRGIVETMVESKALSLPERMMYIPGLSPALKALKSDEILRESVTDRISFTHNIIFDYAVARLLLDETAIFEFISKDASNAIFFRPSLTFFFHYVWFEDRKLFWNLATQIFGSSEVPERARVIAAVAIYEMARQLGELDPITGVQSEAANQAIAGVLRGIQAFGGLQSERRELWLSMLTLLAGRMDIDFVNEYVSLLNIAGESMSGAEEDALGKAARKLLHWMWSSAPDLGEERAVRLADVGAARVFPVVMKCFSSEPKESKQIVVEVMERFSSPVSGPHEVFSLAHNIRTIIENDPLLATEVYKRMFSYDETREDKTAMGGSMILQLTSTRKQDFSTARYVLLQGFQHFLQLAPVEAARAAAASLSCEIEREQSSERCSQNTSEFSFAFRGHTAKYRSDFSEIWDSGFERFKSIQLFRAALNRATELLTSNQDDVLGKDIIRQLILKNTYASGWKGLFEVATSNCRALYRQIFELLTVPQLISAPETTISVGNLLKKAYADRLVNESEALAIEKAISQIPKATAIRRYEKPEAILNRLLMCIPADQIHSANLKALAHKLMEEKEAHENVPYHHISTFTRQFSTEDWMQEQGIHTSAPENARILKAIKPLEEFERKYLNEVPSVEECGLIEHSVREVSNLISARTADDALGEQARGVLYAAAGTVLKNNVLSKEDSITQFCRKMVLEGADDPSPVFNPKHHQSFDMPSWGGQIPRIEAAQGLCHYLWNWGADGDVVSALETLSKDKVPAVRFQVANGLVGFYKQGETEKFWSLIEGMLANEQTAGVALAIVDSLGRVAGADPQRVVSILSNAIDRGLPATDRSELPRNVVQILTGLYVAQNNDKANEQLQKLIEEPAKYHSALGTVIFVTSHYLSGEQSVSSRATDLLQRIVAGVYNAWLVLAGSASSSKDKGQAFADLLGLLNEVSFRVYIALDVNPQLRPGEKMLTDPERRERYFELKPIIELLTVRLGISGDHFLAPITAHNLLQTLNSVFDYDPKPVITYAAAVCKASARLNYQFDASAIEEMVRLVEHVLADHKDLLLDTTIATAVADMLDIFARAGWPQAVKLTFKLDQAIR